MIPIVAGDQSQSQAPAVFTFFFECPLLGHWRTLLPAIKEIADSQEKTIHRSLILPLIIRSGNPNTWIAWSSSRVSGLHTQYIRIEFPLDIQVMLTAINLRLAERNIVDCLIGNQTFALEDEMNIRELIPSKPRHRIETP